MFKVALNSFLKIKGVRLSEGVWGSVICFAFFARFQSESGSLNLHQGLPMPSDAFAQLLAFGDSGAKLIETETHIDDLGNVIVEIQKYDPLAIKSMELSLLPMLPDRVSWQHPQTASIANSNQFRSSVRCEIV